MGRTYPLIFAAAAMAVSTIAAKSALDHGASPGDLLAARCGIAAIGLIPLLPMLKPGFAAIRDARVSSRVLAVAGLLVFSTITEFGALGRLPAAVVIVIVVSGPGWSALIRWVLWRERIDRQLGAAIVAVVVGVTLIADPVGGSLDVMGIALALTASIAGATIMVLVESMTRVCSPRISLPVSVLIAGPIALTLDAGRLATQFTDPALFPLLLVVGLAALAWSLLVGRAMQHANAVTATTILAAEPMFVGLLAFVVLGETLSAGAIVGCLVTIAGVILAAAKSESHPMDIPTTL